MKAIIGLGNPGPKYAGTRHNVGYDVVSMLMASPAADQRRVKFRSVVAELTEQGEKVLLVMPETFMNLSGLAVRELVDFYKLATHDLLIICDDINLPLGKIRLRAKGSHGGQNGLRNIEQHLGTDEYPRMRLGVGQPLPGEAVDFVLSRFKQTERAVIEEAITKAANTAMIWVSKGMEAAMNFGNPGKEKPSSKAQPGKPKNQETARVDQRLPERKKIENVGNVDNNENDDDKGSSTA